MLTCRAGCKVRGVSKNRNAGPAKCKVMVRPLDSPPCGCYTTTSRTIPVSLICHGSERNATLNF